MKSLKYALRFKNYALHIKWGTCGFHYVILTIRVIFKACTLTVWAVHTCLFKIINHCLQCCIQENKSVFTELMTTCTKVLVNSIIINPVTVYVNASVWDIRRCWNDSQWLWHILFSTRGNINVHFIFVCSSLEVISDSGIVSAEVTHLALCQIKVMLSHKNKRFPSSSYVIAFSYQRFLFGGSCIAPSR